MKKLLLALVLLAGTTITANAQVTFEKDINDTAYIYPVYNSSDVVFRNDYVMGSNAEIYDQDFNFLKTIQTSIFNDDSISIRNIAKNILLADGKYEIIVQKRRRVESNYVYTYKAYNEDGTLIFDFGDYEPMFWILTGNEDVKANKLLARKDAGKAYIYKIYTLPNYVPFNNNNNSSAIIPKMANNAKKSRSYPNPATGNITIEYNISGTSLQQMNIVNMNGQVMETILVNPAETTVNVNTTRYTPGAYVYQVGTTSGKFIVK